MSQPTIFISYTHVDRDFVDNFSADLKACGLKIWIDKWEIGIGDSIIDRVYEGISVAFTPVYRFFFKK